MVTSVRPFDIECEPSPSAPAETLLQNGWKTYLLFFAVSKEVDESGHLKDLGVAILDCENCAMSKFGYPNDEGLTEHPLYASGIARAESCILEVVGSSWEREVTEQRLASARRIWGGRNMDWDWARKRELRHFIVLLKENTFECLATSLSVERFCSTFEDAQTHVLAELSKY
jgi:hypothetical protein